MADVQIIDLTRDNIRELGICGYKSMTREGFPQKAAWMENRIKEGLKIKILFSPIDGNQGMIEYIPGKYAWRPVEAEGYIFIHCIILDGIIIAHHPISRRRFMNIMDRLTG